MQPLSLSAIDEARFGVRTAKASSDDPAHVEQLFDACRAQRVRLLIVRIPCQALQAVLAVQQAGGLLMDVLNYFEHALPSRADEAMGARRRICLRHAAPSDAELVEGLAREAFRDYPSHYRNDPKLNPQDADEVYPSWARSCCERATVQEPVIVMSDGARSVGFAALRRSSAYTLDVPLLAIAPWARGRGQASQLLRHLLVVASALGARRLTYSTQITNLAMQRIVAREGFLLIESVYTFHAWIEPHCP